MKCLYPIMLGKYRTQPVGCGQCLNCRINQKRVWKSRIMLESACNGSPVFGTLTFDDESLDKLPKSPGGLPYLNAAVWQNWMKRARNYMTNGVRFYACAEYGDNSGRPHFHFLFWNVDIRVVQYAVDKTWTFGHSMILPAEKGVEDYVSGYVTKKATKDVSSLPADGS